MNKAAPKISLNCDKNKDTQINQFQQYLFHNIATVAMAYKAIGISEKKLCRYKILLQERGLLFLVYRGLCKKTGFKASFITTNSKLKSEYLTKFLKRWRKDNYGL